MTTCGDGRLTCDEETIDTIRERVLSDVSARAPFDAVTGNEDRVSDGAVSGDARATKTDREVAVSVTSLSKRFGDGADAVTAVDDVSFDAETGSIVGLLGPNGAGKTTLIKSVLGMVLPDEGTVEIRGIDVYDRPREAYTHVDAMLEGARNDYWRLTVRENLRYFATISGVDPDSVRDRHDRLLAQLGLAEKADVPVRDLSRGMKQKVSLASVLAGGATVVFLDEPTLGLDIESSRTLQRELRRLVEEEDLTVILSSHDMDVVETVCDRVLIMSAGKIIADDTVDSLLRETGLHCVQITSTDLDAQIVSTLRGQFDTFSANAREAGYQIEVTTDSDGLYALLALLRTSDVTLGRVRTVEPDLEDVFVDLTAGDRTPGER
ncbi:ABC transporter-related protein [Natronolimnohabitans innermongolicus JCM 12255]|uniref:ABC transporter-related protein n=1 Tax=Natronolimnohabitans innermongolicus JCM 12255 TaxID=1227499 RepID=L9WKJ0_9EURY|nr:ABC transporter-related protein [Natronolimnohabitans innermongolicus JCM 12255]